MRPVYTECDIPLSGELRVAAGSIFTPSAKDLARERKIEIVEVPADKIAVSASPERTVAIGADHGGFRTKQALIPIFAEMKLAVRDVGVFEEQSADYPDIALAVANLVASGEASRGVVIDGAGVGSAMAANKVPGIRAALCYDIASARNSREHNDANILTLGGRLLTISQAETVLRTWLGTPFAGGRHQPRVQKIMAIGAAPKQAATGSSVASLIDHTLLKPEATANEIAQLCQEARQYGFASVCIHPCWVSTAAALLAGSRVKVCTVIGFPLGANATTVKCAEAETAIRCGASELDMVMNIGALKSGSQDWVRQDIAAVARVAHSAGAILKVILETALLTDEEKTIACALAKQAKADFVKTSTGFSKHGATAHDVALMRKAVGGEMGVKASGGIRTIEDLQAMVEAGATRIGASASVKIVGGVAAAQGSY